jgi:hypothetical protein
LHTVGLAQDFKRTSDIEQQHPWRDNDKHRDAANLIRTRPRVGMVKKYFTECSGFPRRH